MKKWEIGFLIGLGGLGVIAFYFCYLFVTIVTTDTLNMLAGRTVDSLSESILAITGAIFSGFVGIGIFLFMWSKVFLGREETLKSFDFPSPP